MHLSQHLTARRAIARGLSLLLAASFTIVTAYQTSDSQDTKPQAAAVSTPSVDLSPVRWGTPEVDRLLKLGAEFGGDKIPADGHKGIITGTTGPAAVQAGLSALDQGGTAVDAAVTTALTQIALAAGSWVSYAGIFNMVYYEAATGAIHNLNGGYNTVLAENDPASIPAGTASGRTALVPGFMAAAGVAHRRFGKLPWPQLFEPALYFADNGFVLTPFHQTMIDRRHEVLNRLPETRAVFTKADDSFFRAGDLFKQPQLAATLRHVATEGASYMYTGEWAKRLVEAVQRDGGKLTMEDMALYKPTWETPVTTDYHGFRVVAHGLPAQGGVHVVEALNVMDAANLAAMGHYTRSPEAFFWLTQITQLLVLDFLPEATRTTMLGGHATLQSRTGPAFAKTLWERMAHGEFSLTRVPQPADPKHSDAIVVIDQWGNIAAIVHTINTSAWGSTGIFVDGVSIPDSASFQQLLIAETGPGKRLPDTTEPLLILRNGKPVAALSSIGSGLHQKTMSVLLNLLDEGMTIDAAITTASQHMPAFDKDGTSTPQVIEGDFSDELLAGVEKLGLHVARLPNTFEARAPRGYVIGATIDPVSGERRAATENFLNGLALAQK